MVGGKFHTFLAALLSLGAHAIWHSRQDHVAVSQLDNISQGLRGAARTQVSVAVVGSGPISEADRALIRGAREIYRFNSMNNLRRGEIVGNVFLRRRGHSGELISGLPPYNACPLIEHADRLLIILEAGPPPNSNYMKHLRSTWPSVDIIEEQAMGMQEIDGERVWPNGAGWTTGFVGVAHVLKNSPLVRQGHMVHIFGMNWKLGSAHSNAHPWMREKAMLTNAKSIVVHPTNAYHYKPRNVAGEKMLSCEGSYSILMGSAPLGNNTAAVPSEIVDDSFGRASNNEFNSSRHENP